MLVNPSGLPGHWMGIDMNIEHLIRSLKFLFAAKGVRASWDRLGDISAGIDFINRIKKQVGLAMRGYRGQRHHDADTSDLLRKVAKNVREYELLSFKRDRERYPNISAKPATDILMEGKKKLRSSLVKTFNDKIRASLRGRMVDDEGASVCEEQDEIAPMALECLGDENE
jgi:hypothetical protein